MVNIKLSDIDSCCQGVFLEQNWCLIETHTHSTLLLPFHKETSNMTFLWTRHNCWNFFKSGKDIIGLKKRVWSQSGQPFWWHVGAAMDVCKTVIACTHLHRSWSVNWSKAEYGEVTLLVLTSHTSIACRKLRCLCHIFSALMNWRLAKDDSSMATRSLIMAPSFGCTVPCRPRIILHKIVIHTFQPPK